MFVTIGAGAGVFLLTMMASYAQRYTFDELMRTAQDTQKIELVIASNQNEGSFYTLGDIDYSAMGLLKVAPKAINVSLFRPYIWEIRKPYFIGRLHRGHGYFFSYHFIGV